MQQLKDAGIDVDNLDIKDLNLGDQEKLKEQLGETFNIQGRIGDMRRGGAEDQLDDASSSTEQLTLQHTDSNGHDEDAEAKSQDDAGDRATKKKPRKIEIRNK